MVLWDSHKLLLLYQTLTVFPKYVPDIPSHLSDSKLNIKMPLNFFGKAKVRAAFADQVHLTVAHRGYFSTSADGAHHIVRSYCFCCLLLVKFSRSPVSNGRYQVSIFMRSSAFLEWEVHHLDQVLKYPQKSSSVSIFKSFPSFDYCFTILY